MYFHCLRGRAKLPRDTPRFSVTWFVPSFPVSSLRAFPTAPHVTPQQCQTTCWSSHMPSHLTSPLTCSLLSLECPSLLYWKNPLPSSTPSSVILPGNHLWLLPEEAPSSLSCLSIFYTVTMSPDLSHHLLKIQYYLKRHKERKTLPINRKRALIRPFS